VAIPNPPEIMPIVYMPELMMQKILEIGIWDLQTNPDKLDYIFNTYNLKEFSGLYGQSYIEEIKEWFVKTDIPVIQSWSFNPDRIPCISVHLNSEVEDIDKAAINDYWGENADGGSVGVGVFNVSLTFGVHAAKNGNYVLWLYYILHHILFTYKLFIEKMGLQLHTFTGGDYIHDQKYIANHIWSRWVNFNCVVQNCWTTLSEQDYEVQLRLYLDRANVENIEEADPILVFDRKLDNK
jgi:hypothetical protein